MASCKLQQRFFKSDLRWKPDQDENGCDMAKQCTGYAYSSDLYNEDWMCLPRMQVAVRRVRPYLLLAACCCKVVKPDGAVLWKPDIYHFCNKLVKAAYNPPFPEPSVRKQAINFLKKWADGFRKKRSKLPFLVLRALACGSLPKDLSI